jgi:hypothetical protein
MIKVKNAELLRYMRSELRLSRVATIVSGTVFGAGLLSLILSAAHEHQPVTRLQYWREVYAAIFVVSTLVLILWTLINASQAVVSERTHRTFDFWRTTRLSPMTLAIGKLIGAPIGAWLQFVVALPILVFAGVMGGYSVLTTVGSMLVIAMFNLALGSLALCLSMRARDPRRSSMLTLLLAFFLIPNLGIRARWIDGGMAGNAWSAFNPMGGLAAWHEGYLLKVMLFGRAVPSVLVTILLSLAVIAWSMAALVRSIKMEPEQRSLFSPVQVVGISASVLLFVYAAFHPNFDSAEWTLNGLMATGVGATFLCLYFTVVSTLFSRDNLRHRLRGMSAGQVAGRLVAPWIATGVIGLFAAVWALVAYRGSYAGMGVPWVGLIGLFLAVTAYAIRDGMFLQWMISQRVKLPVLKGAVLLICYYVGSGVLAATLVGPERMGQMLRWLTPIAGDPSHLESVSVVLVIAMLAPPLATAGLLASGVFRKMQRSSASAARPVSA